MGTTAKAAARRAAATAAHTPGTGGGLQASVSTTPALARPKPPGAAARWFSAWRRPQRAHQTDFADLGTAFGLDLSLNQMLLDAERPAVVTPPPRRSWVQRLARRKAVD